jgi:hypothetical protein
MQSTHLATALPTGLRPHSIRFQGHDLDPAVCFQRYCPLRACYVIQSRKDTSLCLETPHRLPGLALRGKGPEVQH